MLDPEVRSAEDPFMSITRLLAACSLVLGLSTSALAGDTPPRNIDLKAPDGSNLKATYYDAGKPGPAIVMVRYEMRSRGRMSAMTLKCTCRSATTSSSATDAPAA